MFGGLKEKPSIYIFTRPFFISPSFTWGIPLLGFLCVENLGCFDSYLCVVCCNRFVVCLRAPNSVVGVCLKLVVRAPDSTLKDFNSGRWTRPLWRSSSENRVRPLWRWGDLHGEPHTPPMRRTPLTRRNSGIHPHLCVLPLWFTLSLPCTFIIVSCLVLLVI